MQNLRRILKQSSKDSCPVFLNYFSVITKKKLSCFAILVLYLIVSTTGCSNRLQAGQKTGFTTVEKRSINPWTWQDKYGFVQANEVTGGSQMLFCAGQISVDENGNILHPGDMEKQINQIFDNLETILEQSDFELSDAVRFTYYTTDVAAFTKSAHVISSRYKKGNCKPATSLIGIASLARPDSVVEIEATFMK